MSVGFTCLGRLPMSKHTKLLLKLILVCLFRNEKTPFTCISSLLMRLLIVDSSTLTAFFSILCKALRTSSRIGGLLFHVRGSFVIPCNKYASENGLSIKDF